MRKQQKRTHIKGSHMKMQKSQDNDGEVVKENELHCRTK